MAPVLEVLSRERLRVLRLNRPERKNALNDELFGALFAALREAAHDDDVWAVAITGNGDAFCSGLDLNQDSGGAGSDGDDALVIDPTSRAGSEVGGRGLEPPTSSV